MRETRYTILQLAKLAGVSTRTLRHYDALGLLPPLGREENTYRMYGPAQVNRLQQILFYRELGLALEEIRELLDSPSFSAEEALQSHLQELKTRQTRLGTLIHTVERTLATLRGEAEMKDEERFMGFKREMIAKNEAQHGKEARQKYGDTAVDDSNARLMGLSPTQFARVQELSEQINLKLREAVAGGDPAGPLAQEACALHREWLEHFWGQYSAAAHRNLGEMYVADPRFRQYYDAIVPGGAEFLRDALRVYCGEDGRESGG